MKGEREPSRIPASPPRGRLPAPHSSHQGRAWARATRSAGHPAGPPTAQPTCRRAGAAAHRASGGAGGGRDVRPSALGAAVGAAPAAPQELPRFRRGRQGAPRLLQSRVPGAPKPGPGSAQDGAESAPRMEEPVLTEPTGAGAGEHGPAGPGAPAGRQGEGRRRWRAPSDGAGALLTRSPVGPARRSRAAGRKAHARPVGRARSAGVRPFLRGREVRCAGGPGTPVIPVVPADLGN